jgi:ribosomal protein L24E
MTNLKKYSDNCLICGKFIEDGEGHYVCPNEGLVCQGHCKKEYDRRKIYRSWKVSYVKND